MVGEAQLYYSWLFTRRSWWHSQLHTGCEQRATGYESDNQDELADVHAGFHDTVRLGRAGERKCRVNHGAHGARIEQRPDVGVKVCRNHALVGNRPRTQG